MKPPTLISSLLLLAAFKSFGQKDTLYNSLIERELRKIYPANAMRFCSDRLPEYVVNSIKNDIKKKNIKRVLSYSSLKKADVHYYLLTRKERKTIINTLSTEATPWYFQIDSTIKVEFIVVDTLQKHIDNINLATMNSVKNNPDLIKTAYLQWAYYISQPVFLRKGKFLFYYFSYFRFSSGRKGCYLAKLKDGNIENIIQVAGGDW